MKEIIVGVDGSDASVDAVRLAGGLAAQSGAHLTVVHVRRSPDLWNSQAPVAEEAETFRQATEGRVADQSARALGGSQVPWTFEVREGDPAAQLELVGRERGADLIVVGACAHTAMYRLRLGSVSNRLVEHADRSRSCAPGPASCDEFWSAWTHTTPPRAPPRSLGGSPKTPGRSSPWCMSATSRLATQGHRS